MILKDTGDRTDFGTGALRDMSIDKGRCDLLPLDVVYLITDKIEFSYIAQFVATGEIFHLIKAIKSFAVRNNTTVYSLILDVSHQYQDGVVKYGERNWEKGLPVWNFIDSGVRHLLKYFMGMDDEPHDRAFVWNMLGAVWTSIHKPSLRSYPIEEK